MGREETVEIKIPENLKRNIERFIQSRPELGFKTVDDFVEKQLTLFLKKVSPVPMQEPPHAVL